MRRLTVLGIDFGRAPLALREDLSFTAQQSQAFYAGFAGQAETELMILSTCNRTEFYLAAAAHELEPAEGGLLGALRRLRPSAAALDSACTRYRHAGPDAVRHMMAVAAGLRSQVRGDAHIARQLRQATEIAAHSRAAGPILERAVQASLKAARRVRAETGIGGGAASVGAAVLGAIRSRFGACARLKVLVIGAGQAARDVAIHLTKQRGASVVFTARKLERSRELAATYGGAALAWAGAAAATIQSDVVVTAVHSRLEWLDEDHLGLARRAAPEATRLLIVDLGVPRNADPNCRNLAGVDILDIDRIQQELAGSLAARERSVEEAERILDHELGRYL